MKENTSVIYDEAQNLTSEQKARVCSTIGAVAAVSGKQLSDENYTIAEKSLLGTIQSGAEVNVIEEITVNGTALTPDQNKSVAITIPTVTVDQTYNHLSANPQSGIAVAQAISGSGQVPAVTQNDDGKVLKASYNGTTGSFNWDSAPSGVPSISSGDVGKVLSVTNDSTGTMGWVDQTDPANNSTITLKTDEPTPITIDSFTLNQSSGKDILLPLATGGQNPNAGLMSISDKDKIDAYPTIPQSGAGKFLKDDGTWGIPQDTTYSDYAGSTHGLVPERPSGSSTTTKFLREDGSWETPTDTTYSGGDGIDITSGIITVDLASSNSGLVIDSSHKLAVNANSAKGIEVGASGVGVRLATNSGLEFSSGLKVKTDGTTIQTNASGELVVIGGGGGGGSAYTAGDGIDISAQDVISAKVDGTSITVNASHELTTSAEANVINGVKLDGAASVLTPDASKNVTIPNAVATGESGATNGLMTADDKKALGTAVQYVENPYEQSSPKNLIAQQMFVVESDQQIVDIVTQHTSLINGKGTLFFRITGI